jgi:hypothetical protein
MGVSCDSLTNVPASRARLSTHLFWPPDPHRSDRDFLQSADESRVVLVHLCDGLPTSEPDAQCIGHNNVVPCVNYMGQL